ncbi:MAG: hypothetical protein CYPHOPRED_003786 [Cyphobasidiales sp. Tagirdzhanova-0007]|nr:MAG: hypothetical protein CYPHOPRED_003786 [Cyphobasidiales sp. Tagirdzhanova-0007]
MKLSTVFATLPALAMVVSAAPHLNSRQSQASKTPVIAKTVTFEFPVASFGKQIPIFGGYRLVGSIGSGSFSGVFDGTVPFNASIDGGVIAPRFYDNGSVIVPDITLFGTTTNGLPYYLSETGVGMTGQSLINFEQFEIGGEYAAASSTFLIDDLIINFNGGGGNVTGTIYSIV